MRGSNIGQPRGCTGYTTDTQLAVLTPGVSLVVVWCKLYVFLPSLATSYDLFFFFFYSVVVLLLLILTGVSAGLSGKCYARRKVFQDIPLLK